MLPKGAARHAGCIISLATLGLLFSQPQSSSSQQRWDRHQLPHFVGEETEIERSGHMPQMESLESKPKAAAGVTSAQSYHS